MDTIFAAHILSHFYQRRKGFAILIDPDKVSEADLMRLTELGHQYQASFFLVGGSLIGDLGIHSIVQRLKTLTKLPVILFPGSTHQLVESADALLFLSLLSGRNPDYLIGKHVEIAPILHQMELEVISTGYLLIDTGKLTTAHYMSNTLPIPYDKPEIAAYTALAGKYLGMQMIYLDGGSGAKNSISPEMVNSVYSICGLPLIVGGGIRSAREAIDIWESGADFVVLGSSLEESPDASFLPELAAYCEKPSIPLR
ncbi:MAG: geranylgeranylglyceryl/heptaprenylglyceryl phosphate synthase [Bacteroidota bacterium]